MTDLRVHAELDDLERHAAAHRLLLLRHVNDAAAAFADLLEQLVAADAVAGLFARVAAKRWFAAGKNGGRRFEKIAGTIAGREQLLHALT